MRPPNDLRAVAILLDALPELRPVVRSLAAELDDDLTAESVLAELAQLVGLLLDARDEERLEAVCAALEALATTPDVGAEELIGYGFFLALDGDVIEGLDAYLGPASARILAALEAGEW
ncbi:MAG TPA: hypothetical protein VKV23_08540 [Acidimicrobiales bacterium]|nr:hypothetical protein [Acidimicrobiales bacterium]